METRLNQLDTLHSFVQGVDKDLTMILQTFRWDRKNLLLGSPLATCRHDNNHKMPLEKMKTHESKCIMKSQGYTQDDELLPEPLNNTNALVKLSTQQIIAILNDASRCTPMFKRGKHCESRCLEPCSLARLQATYSGAERRAIHDAVVQAAPSCHDLADLALPGCSNDEGPSKVKSRTEVLAELRDMRRRRTKYRQPAKTRNYSHVLRDVIKTQMETYSGAAHVTGQSGENGSPRSDTSRTQYDCSEPSCARDRARETYIRKKDVRGEHSNKNSEWRAPGGNRYNASSTSYHSKRSRIPGSYASGRQPSDRCRPDSHYYKDTRNYEYNNFTGGKYFGSEARDRSMLPSDGRYEHKEHRSNDRSERNIKDPQTRHGYTRKRHRTRHSSDESEDSGSTGRQSRDRRTSRRDGLSPSYHGNYKSKDEKTRIKSESLQSSRRPPPGGTPTSLPRLNNRHSGLRTDIKQEKIDSADGREDRDRGKPSRPASNTDAGAGTLIKIEKAETDSQYSSSRSRSGSSDYTEGDATVKEENDRSTHERTGNRQDKSRYYDPTVTSSTRVHSANTGLRTVYFERRSERHGDSTYTGRNYDVPIKGEWSGEPAADGSHSRDYEAYVGREYEKSARPGGHGHRQGRSAGAAAVHPAERRRDDRTHEKMSDTRKHYRRTEDSNTCRKKWNSFHNGNARPDVTYTEASGDERRQRKKYF